MLWWDARKLRDGPTDSIVLEVPTAAALMGGAGTGSSSLVITEPSAMLMASSSSSAGTVVTLGASSLEYNVEAGMHVLWCPNVAVC